MHLCLSWSKEWCISSRNVWSSVCSWLICCTRPGADTYCGSPPCSTAVESKFNKGQNGSIPHISISLYSKKEARTTTQRGIGVDTYMHECWVSLGLYEGMCPGHQHLPVLELLFLQKLIPYTSPAPHNNRRPRCQLQQNNNSKSPFIELIPTCFQTRYLMPGPNMTMQVRNSPLYKNFCKKLRILTMRPSVLEV